MIFGVDPNSRGSADMRVDEPRDPVQFSAAAVFLYEGTSYPFLAIHTRTHKTMDRILFIRTRGEKREARARARVAAVRRFFFPPFSFFFSPLLRMSLTQRRCAARASCTPRSLYTSLDPGSGRLPAR